jgi:parvulin-like peptidyl-prolyl isomerase
MSDPPSTAHSFSWLLCLGLVLSAGCAEDHASQLEPADFTAAPAGNEQQLESRLQNEPTETEGQAGPAPQPDAGDPAEPGTARTEAELDAAATAATAATAEPDPDPVSPVNASPEPTGEAGEPDQPPRLAVGGMVGEVNGQAIYAGTVFKPISDQLAALGRKLSPREFRQRAGELIGRRVRQLVVDRLILGEAMRDLSEDQRRGLRRMTQQKRQELLRKYGRGSLAVAKRNIRAETGQTLDQAVEDFRRQAVVQRYLRQKLHPRVDVSRRDVENYYRQNTEEYNPAVQRKIRLMRVSEQEQAEALAGELENGTDFIALAERSVNNFRSSDGGLLGTQSGNDVLEKPLNDALLRLEAGDYAGPIEHQGDFWFVYVEELQNPEGQSLREVQLEIRQQLRNERFRKLSRDYRQRLLEEGSYVSVEQMTENLLDIAMARYSRPGGDAGEEAEAAEANGP